MQKKQRCASDHGRDRERYRLNKSGSRPDEHKQHIDSVRKYLHGTDLPPIFVPPFMVVQRPEVR